MQRLKLILVTVAVGLGVALTFHFFELALNKSIDYIWITLTNTEINRLFIFPLCILLTIIYFGLQHRFDPSSEKVSSEGFGSMPKPTVINFIKVLGIGLFSLLAGASLGPEAILVPASMLLGAYAGNKIFKGQDLAIKTLVAAGFISLFTAFFHSFIIGVLSLLLVTKQAKTKVTPKLLVIATVASLSTFFSLNLLDTDKFLKTPAYNWSFNLADLIWLPLLFMAGVALIFALKYLVKLANYARSVNRSWWLRAFIAGSILSLLYILGGPLVEFTGNQSIQPMLSDSAELGLTGLFWILLIKLAAISWSKSSGYRGGLVFPMIFTSSVVVAIIQTFHVNLNFTHALLAVITGLILANTKQKVLY